MVDMERNVNLTNIKLIIWDLDETFWKGTISEGEVVPIAGNISFIKNTADMGIVHSICSKNDYSVVQQKMTELDVWNLFVFPSIDWSAKGTRVKSIIDRMKLRYVNVLFIDDNVQNLEEARYVCPGLLTVGPDVLHTLYASAAAAPKTDTTHKRLKQYKVLEEKEASREEFSSNEEFLMSCNIRVEVAYDCVNHVDRIAELVIRSNQLNYTKFRASKEELLQLFGDNTVKCGYVSASDRFGEYGIVGFFAVKNACALHYVFSCRALGMQVEQYIYMQLGCPQVHVQGEVVSRLRTDFSPPWINQNKKIDENCNHNRHTAKVLIKGPCDMSQMYTFFSSCTNITTEFTYTNADGIQTEGHNHTAQLVTALYASDEDKRRIVDNGELLDVNALDTALLREKFDVVVLSMLTDGNLGVYRHRATGFDVALCEKHYNLTDVALEDAYISGKIFTSGIRFTKGNLGKFRKEFECVTDTTWKRTIDNLDRIYSFIGTQTKLVLLLGSEKECTKCRKISYVNRHLEHAAMNRSIREWARNRDNVELIGYDQYIHSESDFIDTVNHFVMRVYYDLAADLLSIFDVDSEIHAKRKGKKSLYMARVKQVLKAERDKLLEILKR